MCKIMQARALGCEGMYLHFLLSALHPRHLNYVAYLWCLTLTGLLPDRHGYPVQQGT